jgi:hypothetical protein
MENSKQHDAPPAKARESGLHYDFGTFNAYTPHDFVKLDLGLTADDVITWAAAVYDQYMLSPAGDHAGVKLMFRNQPSVTPGQLLALDRLLLEFGGDSPAHYQSARNALDQYENSLFGQISRMYAKEPQHVSLKPCPNPLHLESACALFEIFFPDKYRAWESSLGDWLVFDADAFLASPELHAELQACRRAPGIIPDFLAQWWTGLKGCWTPFVSSPWVTAWQQVPQVDALRLLWRRWHRQLRNW